MRRLIRDACSIFEAGVGYVQADKLLNRSAWLQWISREISAYRRVVVVGMGKAAMAMAGTVEAQLGQRIDTGAVVVPKGYREVFPKRLPAPRRIRVMEGGHPIPDASSIRAARRILALADTCGRDDLLLVLVSGGGTALCADPAPGLLLEDTQYTFRLLLEGGADIHDMNAVRKHLLRIGGGRLAQAAAPAEVLALVVSDVVGNDLSVIAGGPATPDPTSFSDAVDVLRRHRLWNQTPENVRTYLQAGMQEPALETPKPESALFEHVRAEVIAANRDALRGAREEALARGYAACIVAEDVTGEARDVGKRLAQEVRDAKAMQPLCLLWGGETTVTVRGKGKGGRNQEVALAAALSLEGFRGLAVLLSGGTDGRDGPTEAAGAWATTETASAARERGTMPEYYLANNDAYTFFQEAGSLLITGATHTNVMDVQIALIASNHDTFF